MNYNDTPTERKRDEEEKDKIIKAMASKKKSVTPCLVAERAEGEPDDWRNYLRMDTSAYCQLLELVRPYILKQDRCTRKVITPHERLTATLRYLARGRSLKDLEFKTIISKPALSQIFPETCDAICLVLKNNYLKVST